MERVKSLEAYYEKEHPFKEGIALLRNLAQETDSIETLKWNFPVYTVNGKNVFGICRFKSHFGVWFFNGSFLIDPKKVLRNAQEGKTKGMRHWNFESIDEVDQQGVVAYMNEAIDNERKGLKIVQEKKSGSTEIPTLLQSQLDENNELNNAFEAFTPYKQREFCEYISEAKQEKTKLRRLEKILPMILKGVGLNDAYR
ncbi:YdeI/OmpD-associated family protein [Flagellimonas myxillae]|uniref:YdeI/OmpD-associated family protein n=1 Tax=Flagellimonas myxillae TaxID=2942214 RepID=UPI00201F5ACD|nr:YdeI/OmpD-associated family protein [Muricauda myxillae]MCL6265245.1 YdeI/OmpD-associated family protein [Muricauda myxillae]